MPFCAPFARIRGKDRPRETKSPDRAANNIPGGHLEKNDPVALLEGDAALQIPSPENHSAGLLLPSEGDDRCAGASEMWWQFGEFPDKGTRVAHRIGGIRKAPRCLSAAGWKKV